MQGINEFFRSELEKWPLAAGNFKNLGCAYENSPSLTADGTRWQLRKLLVNHRRASLSAKIDAGSIAARPCFLCAANRPEQQSAMPWHNYEILVNPYPLASIHLTIASRRHEPQRLAGHIGDMAELTRFLGDLCVFYNGPLCGASAPDHLHFQAATADVARNILSPDLRLTSIFKSGDTELLGSADGNAPFPFFIIDAAGTDALVDMAGKLIDALPAGEPEPMVNVAMVKLPDGRLRTFIAPRSKHRPECYGTDAGKRLISPASVEMLGTIVCSRENDFNAVDAENATAILAEVGMDKKDFADTINRLKLSL